MDELAFQSGGNKTDNQGERKMSRSWQSSGYCDAHKGTGTNLNIAYPSGRVARYYGLKKRGWVCQECWEKARSSFTSERRTPE